MATTIAVGGKTLTANDFIHLDYHPKWTNRHLVEFTVTSTYAEMVEAFVSDVAWSVVNETTVDMSEYSVPGPITDNRDGTITVTMGKPTELEKMIETIYGGVN